MEAAFRDARYAEGVEAGLADINALLARHYPRDDRSGEIAYGSSPFFTDLNSFSAPEYSTFAS